MNEAFKSVLTICPSVRTQVRSADGVEVVVATAVEVQR